MNEIPIGTSGNIIVIDNPSGEGHAFLIKEERLTKTKNVTEEKGQIKATSGKKEFQPVTEKSAPPPNSFSSSSEIRNQVKIASTSLQGETMASRVQSIRVLLPSLPDDLNGQEVALLAGDETFTYRQQILELLVARVKPNSLNPDDIPIIIDKESFSYRANCIKIIAPYIKGPITGKQATAILSSETFSFRVQCLRPIAPLLQKHLSASDVHNIVEGTLFSDRTEAIKLIFGEK